MAFFYDEEDGAWGFSPEDRGSCVVVHDCTPAEATLQATPPSPEPILHPSQSVAMRPHLSMPTPDRAGISLLELEEAEWEAIDEFSLSIKGDGLLHQVAGWPHPIQNDIMELESQLASNGVYCGGPDGYASDAAKALAPGADEWRLLLQLDSDDASEMMWGDGGILYFWVREGDARAGNFANVWLILQCY